MSPGLGLDGRARPPPVKRLCGKFPLETASCIVHDTNIVQAHLVLKDKTFCCVEVCKKLVAAWQTLPDVIKL